MAKKEINLVLDTMEKPNRPIGTFKELDDIVFNFQIIENGKPKNLTSQEIRLYIAKPDKTVIQQTEQIQITSAVEGKVKIDLLNLATKVQGLNMGEISISDEEGRINTASFCYNVVSTIINDEVIESTNVIGVVKELEDILRKFKGDLEEFDKYQKKIKPEEEERKSSEIQRKLKEQLRENSEEERKASERVRISAEEARVSAEETRVLAENSRVSAERIRISAESSRVSAESSRVSAEEARALAERTREDRFDERFEEIKGEPGRDGVDGKSAYQVAQENGFEGTESEWLESLKGEKGEGLKADDKTISKNNVWSSEKVAKEIYDNTSIWKPINGENVTIIGARDNGYIRGFELEGKNPGVGDLQDNGKYKIDIVARGKNLFNKYGEFNTGNDDLQVPPTLKKTFYNKELDIVQFFGQNGVGHSTGPYLKFKPNTDYTLSTIIYSNGDEPISVQFHSSDKQYKMASNTNGEKIQLTTRTTGDGRLWISFLTNRHESGAKIYGGKNIQIEEGAQATEYEKEKIKTILLPQQLKQNEVFKWSKEKDKYIIASEGQEIDTEIQEEIFIKTIQPTMYLESSNALKPTIKGEYPIDGIKALREENARLEETITGIYRMLNVQTLEETEHIEQDIMTTEEL